MLLVFAINISILLSHKFRAESQIARNSRQLFIEMCLHDQHKSFIAY